jgi:hypothetical protein
MQSYHTIFNSEVISENFSNYKREKMAKSISNEKEVFGDDKVKEYWTLENGYSTTIPYRAIPSSTIKLILSLNESDYAEKCISFKEGFKVIFHLPNENADNISQSRLCGHFEPTYLNHNLR